MEKTGTAELDATTQETAKIGGTLYVPGFGGGSVLPKFFNSFPQPVVTVDFRGCVKAYEFESKVEEALRTHRPRVIAGHSLGGYLTLDVLRKLPEPPPHLERLLLFGMGTKVEPGTVLRTMAYAPLFLVYLFFGLYFLAAPYFFLKEGKGAKMRFRLVKNLRYLGVAKAVASCRETLFHLCVDESCKVPVETHIVALRGDIIVPDDDVIRLSERIPGSRIQWLEAKGIHLTTALLDEERYTYTHEFVE